jgi:predicted RNA-binding protein YlqC (UPF0109 family)
MIVDFITDYTKLIVSQPDSIKVEVNEIDPTFYEIIIFAANEDLGKLIGKNGNMINSLKTMINGCKAKNGVSYKIQILKA